MFSAKCMVLLWIVLTYQIFDCTINAYVIHTDEPIDHRKVLKMDVVTACQMNCLEEFLFDGNEIVNPFWNVIDRCIERSNCYMCYDFCEMLNDESRMIGKLMCTNDTCVRILKIYYIFRPNVKAKPKYFLFSLL